MPVGRVGRVERQVGGAGLEHGEQRDDQVARSAAAARRRRRSGAAPGPDQVAGQPVGARRRARRRSASPSRRRQRDGVRGARGLRREQLRQRRGRQPRAGCRSSSVEQRGAAPPASSSVELADAASGVGGDRGRAAGRRRSASVSTVARSNRSVAYSSDAAQAGGRAVGGAVLGEAEGQVELGDRRRGRARRVTARPGKPTAPVSALFCRVSITWNSGWRASGPGRVERLDEPLERHVLVGVGGQVGRPAPGRSSSRKVGSPRGRCAAPGC